MHHALHIEEILLSIFSYCYSDRSSRRSRLRYANAHLAALARTCKTFKEPALDMIWSELDDLTPLVRCLPEASWVVSGGVHSLQKCLEQTDWDVILGYAHRVRALPLLCGSSGLATDCIEALSNSPSSTESIFPNLRSVGLQAPIAKMAPLVRHLANPKLTRIFCQFTELNLGAVIATFGERCPFVTDFHVLEWTHADTTSGLICCWQNLCSVRCFNVGLNADALLHLSRLHYLRYVVFKVHDAVIDRIHTILSPASTLTFPTLNVLRLNSDYLTHIRRLFHHFHTPEVHDLSVGLDALPAAPDLMSFFVSLQEACTHTSLNQLSLNVYPYGNIEPNDIPLSPYYVTFDPLRPLTIFVNIKDIRLNIPCGVDLNERELLRLASSWPR